METWVKAVGYEGYEVSNLGNVRSCEKVCKNGVVIPTHLITVSFCKHGYRYVIFNKNHIHKRLRVCRLVATAFIPNPDNLPQVNHKNENKADDRVENLEWCTARQNSNYGERNRKIAEANKGKRSGDLCYFKNHKFVFSGAGHYKATPIIQCELDGTIVAEYPSIVDATNATGFPASSLSACLTGRTKKSHGFVWRYKKNQE